MTFKRHEKGATLYEEITSSIIAELEAGQVPWVQPWNSDKSDLAQYALPRNAISKNAYSGINVIVLWNRLKKRGFTSPIWLTYRQALHLGGHVRSKESGTTVCYASTFTPKDDQFAVDDQNGEAAAIPFLKRYTLFNVDQCDHLPEDLKATPEPIPEGLIFEEVQTIIDRSQADFRIGGEKAYYMVEPDFVQIPHPLNFHDTINWHRTALHELGHWTGHPSRLCRELACVKGSKKYAFEELVAELTAAYTCASLGIQPTVRHADYIATWLELLKSDDHAIFKAASLASKAANYLLAYRSAIETPEIALAA